MSAPTVTRCEKSWLPKSMCAHCLGHEEDPPPLGVAAWPTPPMHVGKSTFPNPPDGLVYTATAPVACDWCGATIRVSEPVAHDFTRDLNACQACMN